MKGQFIYKIINTHNGKFYVGSTTNTQERFRVHRKRLRSNKHHCRHLQASWNKYGESCFVFCVIESVPPGESLEQAENKWLSEHVGKEHCYNISRHADTPFRDWIGEKHPRFGKPRTAEERLLISASLKEYYGGDVTKHPRFGKKHSPETIVKIVETRKANGKQSGENHYRYGKTLSAEVRKKIGDTQRGVKKGPRVYTEEGRAKLRESAKRNARPQPPKPWNEVYEAFAQSVKDKYDFSNAVYTHALVRITGVICPKHGEFSQYSALFRKGRGCPLCGADQRAEKKRAQMKKSWASPEGRQLFMENRKPMLDATGTA
jgi:group I intron endonuclease